MLLLNNNHISKIQETSLADAIGNLEYLILTGNRIAQLADIDRLAGLSKLDTLSLCGNPVAKRKFYREYVIHKLPQLRVLDFQKIKPHVRVVYQLWGMVGVSLIVMIIKWILGTRGDARVVPVSRWPANRGRGSAGNQRRAHSSFVDARNGTGMEYSLPRLRSWRKC